MVRDPAGVAEICNLDVDDGALAFPLLLVGARIASRAGLVEGYARDLLAKDVTAPMKP